MKLYGVILRTLTFLGWGFILFSTIYDLFIFPTRSIVWALNLALLMFIYFKFEKIPDLINFLLVVVSILNMFGELYFGFYYVNECANGCINIFYDKILHFTVPIVISFLIFFIFKDRIKERNMLILFTICAVISLEVVWEIVEYIFDKVLGGYYQGIFLKNRAAGLILNEIEDTMLDLVLTFGGVITFWIASIISNKEN